VTQNLTKSLIDLSGFGLASQGNSKLRLDHVKRSFDVRPLVVALHKPLRVETVKMKHLPPDSGTSSIRLRPIKGHTVALEGNVRLRVMVYHRLQISTTKTAQINEALCKVLCHNLCCLIQSMFELNVKPEFWAKETL
jgi:hypothetical protein